MYKEWLQALHDTVHVLDEIKKNEELKKENNVNDEQLDNCKELLEKIFYNYVVK